MDDKEYVVDESKHKQVIIRKITEYNYFGR